MQFKDLGMPFPLFDAPIEAAVTDDKGTCAHCSELAEIRFEGTCYDCFRQWKAHDVTRDTEFGMVRPADAEKGLTHGMPLENEQEIEGYELVANHGRALLFGLMSGATAIELKITARRIACHCSESVPDA